MSVRTKAIIALVSFIIGIVMMILQQMTVSGILMFVTLGFYMSARRQMQDRD